eukprot:scaffold61789_cov21-Tisochrysis_lutea.AAC.2
MRSHTLTAASLLHPCVCSPQLDDEEDQMVSLLNLALLSRNRDMLARVLAWGHSLGGPNFAWSWRAQDAHGITPLLRIQVRVGGMTGSFEDSVPICFPGHGGQGVAILPPACICTCAQVRDGQGQGLCGTLQIW